MNLIKFGLSVGNIRYWYSIKYKNPMIINNNIVTWILSKFHFKNFNCIKSFIIFIYLFGIKDTIIDIATAAKSTNPPNERYE